MATKDKKSADAAPKGGSKGKKKGDAPKARGPHAGAGKPVPPPRLRTFYQATVRKRLMDSHRLLGFQNFLALLQFATLPRDLTEKNIRMFASEVLPTLQSLTDKEYAGMQTQAAE